MANSEREPLKIPSQADRAYQQSQNDEERRKLLSGESQRTAGYASNQGDADLLSGAKTATPYITDATKFNMGQQAPAIQAAQGTAARAFTTAINPTAQQQWGNYQTALANQLQAQANGTAPSLAGIQLQAGTDAAINAARSAAASSRGVNAAVASANAARGISGAVQQGAGQAAQLRLQEQQAAQGQLANLANTAQSQGNQFFTNQAGLVQQTNLADAEARNQYGLAGFQAGQNQEQLNAQNWAQANSNNADIAKTNIQANKDLVGAATGAASGALSIFSKLSDERAKTDIKTGSLSAKEGNPIEEFLKAMDPKTFFYKAPGPMGEKPGKQLGVMAQDILHSSVGTQMVDHSPDGMLRINLKDSLGPILASLSYLNEKIEELAPKGKK